MLLNRVRCEAMEKIRVYFDRNLCRFLPQKRVFSDSGHAFVIL